MKPSHEIAHDIIYHLGLQLAKSWQSFLVAKLVHEGRNTGRINCMYHFFSSVEESCLETAVLILAKIAVPHDDSINIQYLLNFSEQNPDAYLSTDNNLIRDLVSQHKTELENFKHLLDNIKEQRDRSIAHLDKKHIKNPSAVYTHPPLNFIEVEGFYKVLLNIVNAYSKYLVPSTEIRLDNIEPGVKDDFEYLTSLIGKDNAED